MCVVCGLPSTHANFGQYIGFLAVSAFVFVTVFEAWWFLTKLKLKKRKKEVQKEKLVVESVCCEKRQEEFSEHCKKCE